MQGMSASTEIFYFFNGGGQTFELIVGRGEPRNSLKHAIVL